MCYIGEAKSIARLFSRRILNIKPNKNLRLKLRSLKWMHQKHSY